MTDWAEVVNDIPRELGQNERIEIKRGKTYHMYGVEVLSSIPKDEREASGIYVINNTPTPDTTSKQKLSAAKLKYERDVVTRYKDVEDLTARELTQLKDKTRTSYNERVNSDRRFILESGVTYDGGEFDTDDGSVMMINNVMTGMGNGKPLPKGYQWRLKDNTMKEMKKKDFEDLYDVLFTRINAVFLDSWIAKDTIKALVMSDTYLTEAEVVYQNFWVAKYPELTET